MRQTRFPGNKPNSVRATNTSISDKHLNMNDFSIGSSTNGGHIGMAADKRAGHLDQRTVLGGPKSKEFRSTPSILAIGDGVSQLAVVGIWGGPLPLEEVKPPQEIVAGVVAGVANFTAWRRVLSAGNRWRVLAKVEAKVQWQTEGKWWDKRVARVMGA